MDGKKTFWFLVGLLVIFSSSLILAKIYLNLKDFGSFASLLTTIFVALVGMMSSLYGNFQNKQLDIKNFLIKKQIEDIDSQINKLEMLHSKFFELSQRYLIFFSDTDIFNDIKSKDSECNVLKTKNAEVITISLEVGQLFWSNYSVFNDETQGLFNDFSNYFSANNLIDFWLEIKKSPDVMSNPEEMKRLNDSYVQNQIATDFSCSIMANIYALKAKKVDLLKGINVL